MASVYQGLIDALIEDGFEIKQSRGNSHYKILKDGVVICGLPSSASDWRSFPNCLSELRKKANFDYRPKQPRKRREKE